MVAGGGEPLAPGAGDAPAQPPRCAPVPQGPARADRVRHPGHRLGQARQGRPSAPVLARPAHRLAHLHPAQPGPRRAADQRPAANGPVGRDQLDHGAARSCPVCFSRERNSVCRLGSAGRARPAPERAQGAALPGVGRRARSARLCRGMADHLRGRPGRPHHPRTLLPAGAQGRQADPVAGCDAPEARHRARPEPVWRP